MFQNFLINRPDLQNDQYTERFCSARSCIQIGYGVWVNLNLVNVGLAFGFAAVALPQLNQSGVEFQPTLAEAAWIASVIMLTAPFGCLVCGMLVDVLGRKIMMVVSEVLLSGAWAYTSFVYSINDLIIGRSLVGVGLGFILVAPRLYASEITLPIMRGVVAGFSSCAFAIGLTLEATLGMYFEWRHLCYFHFSYCVVMIFLNIFLPESPYYALMTQSNSNDTSDLLKKFRSRSYAISEEMGDLIDFRTDNNICRLTWKEKRRAILMSSATKPFCIVMMLAIFGQFSGVTVLQFYAVEILQLSKSSVDAHLGNVLLSITRLISGIFASILLYNVGRRPLALISYIGVGITSIMLGSYMAHIEEDYVYPQICYTIYVIFASLGHYYLPELMICEIYPLQIRGLLGGISFCVIYLMAFGSTEMFPYLCERIGIHHILIMFGGVSLLGSILIFFYMPETKNLSLPEIEEYYNKRRASLRSTFEIKKAQSQSKSKQSILKMKPLSRSKLLERISYIGLKTSTTSKSKTLDENEENVNKEEEKNGELKPNKRKAKADKNEENSDENKDPTPGTSKKHSKISSDNT